MSLPSSIEKVKLVDNRQAYESHKCVTIDDGCANVAYQIFQANSLNASNLTFQVNVPSLQTGLQKGLQYHLTGTAVITGTCPAGAGNTMISTSGSTVNNGVTVGLSDSCYCQMVASENVQIGNTSNTVYPSTCLELQRINNPTYQDANYRSGMGGAMKDFAINFAPWRGTIRDPLASLFDTPNSDMCVAPRTLDINVVSSTATSVNVEFDFYFNSQVPPFVQSQSDDNNYIRNLSNVIFNLQLETDLSRLFSIYVPTGYTVTGTSVAFTSANIECLFITPSKYAINNYTPLDDIYQYREIQRWLINAPSVAGKGAGIANFQQIVGSTIPEKIIVGVRPVQSNLTLSGALEPRRWLPITNTNIYFNNRTILNSASPRQLYDLSIRNGLTQCTYEQWVGQDVTYALGAGTDASNQILGGSFLVLDPARDAMIIQDDITNGVKAQWTLSGSVSYFNQSYNAVNSVEMVVLAVYDGWLASIEGSGVFKSIGNLSKEEVLSVLNDHVAPVMDNRHFLSPVNRRSGWNGAGWFNKLLDTVAKGAEVYQKNKDLIHSVAKGAYSHAKGEYNRVRGHFKGAGLEEDEEDMDYMGGAILDVSHQAVKSKRDMARRYLRS